MKQMTIKDLAKACQDAIDNGYGDFSVVVRDSNYGFGMHALFGGLHLVNVLEYRDIKDSVHTHHFEDARDNLMVLG